MFDTIVIGIDGRDGGEDALAFARTLAGPGAQLVLVGVYPYEHGRSRASNTGFENLLHGDVVQRLRAAAGDDPRCTVKAVGDVSPGRGLHDAAFEERADLIVVGSSHRGPLGRVLVGDVSRGALHGARCPVAVAPHGYRERTAEPRTIGVAHNDSPQADAAAKLAAAAAKAYGAELRIVTAVPSPAYGGAGYGLAYDWSAIVGEDLEAAKDRLLALKERLGVEGTTRAVEGDSGSVLEALSEEVDVLFAGSRGWGTGRAVVLGSTTDRLVHHAHCPVVIVPSPAGD